MAKTLVGVVSSDKGDKTIVVTVATRKTHPLYKKQYTFSKKFMAHDETNDARVGDKVIIAETKPLSKRKRFILTEVVERAPIRHIEPEVVVKKKSDKGEEDHLPLETSTKRMTAKKATSEEVLEGK